MNENSTEVISETQKVDFFFLFWREFHQPMAFASDNTSFIIRLRYSQFFVYKKLVLLALHSIKLVKNLIKGCFLTSTTPVNTTLIKITLVGNYFGVLPICVQFAYCLPKWGLWTVWPIDGKALEHPLVS